MPIIEGATQMPTPAMGTPPTPPQQPSRSDWGGYGMGAGGNIRQGSGGFNPFMYSAFQGSGQVPFQGAGYLGPFHNMLRQQPFRFFMPAPTVGWNGMQGMRNQAPPPQASQPQQPPQAQPPAMNPGMFGMFNPFFGGQR